MNVSRRSLLVGLGTSLVCAPAIVRASSLMKVKPTGIITLDDSLWAYRIEVPGTGYYSSGHNTSMKTFKRVLDHYQREYPSYKIVELRSLTGNRYL